jgi:hypothetical protein
MRLIEILKQTMGERLIDTKSEYYRISAFTVSKPFIKELFVELSEETGTNFTQEINKFILEVKYNYLDTFWTIRCRDYREESMDDDLETNIYKALKNNLKLE